MRTKALVTALAVMIVAAPALAIEPGNVRLRGLLDLSAAGGDEALDLNAMNQGDSNFDPYRLRLFLDSQFEGGFEAHIQAIVIGQNYAVLQYGAYALWTPFPERDLHLEGGLIPSPIGTWAPRTYSNRNALIGTPMLYQLHGTLSFAEPPPSVDALLAAAGSGERGVDYGNGPNARGAPIVYDRCWDAGLVAIGSARPVEFALGFVQGSPSWPQNARDASPGKTLLGRLGYAPNPAVRIGASGATGPWLPRSFATALPAGVRLEELKQQVAIGDLEIQHGRIEAHAEAYLNEWMTPYIRRLVVRGAWAELRLGMGSSMWIAGRGETMRHSEVTNSVGTRQPWDHDRDRWETGIGYRATRNAILKSVWQRNVERIPGARPRYADLFATSLSLSF